MRQSLTVTVIIIVVIAAWAGEANAQRLFPGGLFRRTAAPANNDMDLGYEEIEAAQPQRVIHAPEAGHLYLQQPSDYGNVYDYYQAMWPKYFGGFHERHWSTYGRPHGDIGRGLRGSAW